MGQGGEFLIWRIWKHLFESTFQHHRNQPPTILLEQRICCVCNKNPNITWILLFFAKWCKWLNQEEENYRWWFGFCMGHMARGPKGSERQSQDFRCLFWALNWGKNRVGKTNKSSGDLRKSVCMEDLPLSLSIYMQHGELGWSVLALSLLPQLTSI